MTVVKGKAYWASVQQPNTTYEPEWAIDILVDDSNRAAFEADGVPIKNKDDERGDFVHIRQRVARRDGTQNESPSVVDAQKQPFTGLIGNGSVVNVMYTPFAWEMNGKSGVSPLLKKVQVVDLVEYKAGEDFDVEDGFTATEAPSANEELNDEVPF